MQKQTGIFCSLIVILKKKTFNLPYTYHIILIKMSSETVIFDLPYPLENLLEHTQFNNKTVVDITNKSLGLVVHEGA